MSNIILFKPARRGLTTPPDGAQGAEILFFTGVRYVRMLDSEIKDAESEAAGADPIVEAQDLVERLQA